MRVKNQHPQRYLQDENDQESSTAVQESKANEEFSEEYLDDAAKEKKVKKARIEKRADKNTKFDGSSVDKVINFVASNRQPVGAVKSAIEKVEKKIKKIKDEDAAYRRRLQEHKKKLKENK